jgi:hypothetical protein
MTNEQLTWQAAYDAEIAAFEAANLPITFGAMKIARERADAAAPMNRPVDQATDEIDPPSPAKPCYVCGTTTPAGHGPNDECPELEADAAWLEGQALRRVAPGDRHR